MISIVLLTKNGGQLLDRCLCKLFSQKIAIPYEVVVIDSGSTDETIGILKRYPIRVHTIPPEEFKFGPTRDKGFSLTSGDYIVSISQDAIPKDEYWLKNLTLPLNDPSVGASYGWILSPQDRSVFFWDRMGLFYFTRDIEKLKRRYKNANISNINSAFRRDAWEKTGFGDTFMSEDKAILLRLLKKGYDVVEVKDAAVYHGHNYSVKELIKRCKNEGLGKRYLEISYTLFDLFEDIVGLSKFKYLLRGIWRRQIQTPAELFFIFIRPVCIYWGNHFVKGYVK